MKAYVNLISDTVTKPDKKMIDYMLNADVGDDVFGMVGTQVRKMLSRKVDNFIAKAWINKELKLKKR